MTRFFIVLLFVLMVICVYTIISQTLYRRYHSSVIIKGAKKHKIAITFDDGPHPVYTPKILDLFKLHEMKATFFIVGELGEKHPSILNRMIDEGHEVAIHHHRHVSAWTQTPWQLRRQIHQCAQVIEKVTNQKPLFYRPPWGHLNMSSLSMAKPYHLVIWTGIFQDWTLKTTKTALVQKLMRKVEDGAIFVLHDNGDTPGADEKAPEMTIAALEEFLPYLKQQGYESITMQQLMNQS
ncbi:MULTISPECIES: polysaccharide deacetylase family protein [Priestia]|jgi:peptidoglycan/xylan/chitin deacetylase (PgdA/CDA1 family)|uniref:polysaccharide deacetylase family protein n=1 Tax=Priestia TaxID=2800373 RepID=UPI0018A27A88|nr:MULTISPECIES: polysaccharide deacetylase family protein [Priestia]MDR7242159.1 peptidoglycan/xylan/chitin deacetylase (PgdA/CDA1 family) [Priestia megaterium]QTL47545.1 polysaccharide deacetylase family protein [Priestia aryabhattai]USL40464.1 polysaccharide deacetylase family protein [Priestia megaterium]